MLSEKCFVVFYVFSFPPGVCVGTLNSIASIPRPSILTFHNDLILDKTSTKTSSLMQMVSKLEGGQGTEMTMKLQSQSQFIIDTPTFASMN